VYGERRRLPIDHARELGTQTNQGAVGFVIDTDFDEILFPLRGQDHGIES
jgi:hypothetical protein